MACKSAKQLTDINRLIEDMQKPQPLSMRFNEHELNFDNNTGDWVSNIH